MKKGVDYYFLIISTVLLVLGLLFLATLSATESLKHFNNTTYYLFHQLIAVGIGLVLGLVAFKVPLSFIRKIAPIIVLLNLVVMAIVFLPFLGIKLWGAKRWINIAGMSVQPSEFLKISSILYVSAWISNKFSEHAQKGWVNKAKKGYHDFIMVYLPFLVFLAIVAIILILQPDVSTLGVISLTLLAIYFASGTPAWHTLLTIVSGFGALLLLIKIEPYRMQRLLIFLHPETDPLGIGFQLKQALIAVGSGGFFGKGLGMSTQKFGHLPQAMGDSIFAIIGEELGIIGAAVLICLFVFFLWRGLKIAISSTDKFAKFTAIGITFWIVLQAFINIASSIGIFPLSGIPLPFFSYGGTHIIAELIGIGLMMNISKNA
jgi:cell division protein FtsW